MKRKQQIKKKSIIILFDGSGVCFTYCACCTDILKRPPVTNFHNSKLARLRLLSGYKIQITHMYIIMARSLMKSPQVNVSPVYAQYAYRYQKQKKNIRSAAFEFILKQLFHFDRQFRVFPSFIHSRCFATSLTCALNVSDR